MNRYNMKNSNLGKYFLLFFLSIGILSCSKDADPEPEELTTIDKKQLQTDIIGKWVVESNSGRTLADLGFIEFLKDSTYIFQDRAQSKTIGKYQVVSGDQISLDKSGNITAIKLTGDKLSFKYVLSAQTISVVAAKTVVTVAGSQTSTLARGWMLTSLEDGHIITDNDLGIDRAVVVISSSGTYLGQFTNKGKVVEESLSNWKWHSTKSDRIVYWETGAQVKEDEDYVIIRELSATTLKTREYHDGVEYNYTWTPLQ